MRDESSKINPDDGHAQSTLYLQCASFQSSDAKKSSHSRLQKNS